MRITIVFLLGFIFLCLSSCSGWKHGLTWREAKDNYLLVTGDGNNLGDRRIEANKNFHKNSALSNFLNCDCNHRGLPDFIYEYQSPEKRRGIRLYYVKLDSVFVFEEPKKWNLQSVLKEARKMDDLDRSVYATLKNGKVSQ